MKNKKIFISCDCGTHLLQVEKDVDYVEDAAGKSEYVTFYLAMFHYGQESSKHSLKERLKNAWRYIKTGKMFSDQISMSVDETKELNEFLTTELKESK